MSECTFCDRSQFEDHIIAKHNGFYVIASLGQITDGYMLVFPEKHVPCIGALTFQEYSEMIPVLRAGMIAASQEYRGSADLPLQTTIFEHGIVGQTVKHAHTHVVPGIFDMTERIRSDFPAAEIADICCGNLQRQFAEDPRPYLYWTTRENEGMVCWNPPAPPQYLRIVLADMLRRPERANWRTMDPGLDKKLWSETVARLKPYFA